MQNILIAWVHFIWQKFACLDPPSKERKFVGAKGPPSIALETWKTVLLSIAEHGGHNPIPICLMWVWVYVWVSVCLSVCLSVCVLVCVCLCRSVCGQNVLSLKLQAAASVSMLGPEFDINFGRNTSRTIKKASAKISVFILLEGVIKMNRFSMQKRFDVWTIMFTSAVCAEFCDFDFFWMKIFIENAFTGL